MSKMPAYDRTEFKRILQQIEKNQLAPVYLLWGERYLYQLAYEELIAILLPEKKRSTNLRVIDGANEDVYRLVEELQTLPLFPGRQVFVVRDTRLFHSKSTADPLLTKSHEYFIKGDFQAAARSLVQAISLSGLAIEDVRDGGWEKISEDTWEKIFGTPKSGEDITWLNEVTSFAIQVGQKESAPAFGEGDILEQTLAKGIPASNHLILLTDTVDRRKSLYRLIEKMGVVVSFAVDKGITAAAKRSQDAVLKDLMKDILTRYGKAMEPRAVSDLIERIGFNPASLAAALEKLISYSGGRKTITLKDIEAVVERERDEPLYELTGAFGDRDAEKALSSLGLLLDQGYAPLQILASLIKHVRRLLLARWALDTSLDFPGKGDVTYQGIQQRLPGLKKEGKIPRELEKLSPYPLFLLLKQARGFPMEHLVQCMSELLKVDMALKSGGITPKLLLEDLILKCLVFNPETVSLSAK
ncbi:MAG: DNA polymerase III subunit delta [Thermodesulfobacteriota bacterium]